MKKKKNNKELKDTYEIVHKKISLFDTLENVRLDLKTLKTEKSNIKRNNAEAEKILEEKKYIKREIELKEKSLEISKTFSEYLKISGETEQKWYENLSLLHKILVLGEIIAPDNVSEFNQNPILTVEGFREEAEAKMMELIRKL